METFQLVEVQHIAYHPLHHLVLSLKQLSILYVKWRVLMSRHNNFQTFVTCRSYVSNATLISWAKVWFIVKVSKKYLKCEEAVTAVTARTHLIARLSFSYVMLLFFFFWPHIWATASDLRNLKTPSRRSSHFIRPWFFSGWIRMSLMNSHRWVPRGAEDSGIK